MKERPILFSGEMVSAILEGRKTQTRRVVFANSKTNKGVDFAVSIIEKDPGQVQDENWFAYPEHGNGKQIVCPYGQAGDRLWVREGFHQHYEGGVLGGRPCYKADGCPTLGSENVIPWKPSIRMPRWASRITLEITDVRAQRVQDISEADAIAEGVPGIATHQYYPRKFADSFAVIWDLINAKRGFSWDSNPWVWVIEFEVLK